MRIYIKPEVSSIRNEILYVLAVLGVNKRVAFQVSNFEPDADGLIRNDNQCAIRISDSFINQKTVSRNARVKRIVFTLGRNSRLLQLGSFA